MFWKLLGADLFMIGFTAMVFPARTGVRLALLVAAMVVASLMLNYILAPVEPLPHPGLRDPSGPPGSIMATNAAEIARVTPPAPSAKLIRRSLLAHEVERAAIAEHLRATAAQQLAALTLHLTAALRSPQGEAAGASLEAAHELASEATTELAALAEQIAPSWRGEFGLVPGLEMLDQRVMQRGVVECELRIHGTIFPLRLALTRALLHVAEEAISNVERHASARSVELDVTFEWPIVRLEISDDAKGFDPAILDRDQPGLGLFRIRELLAHEGGAMQIESTPGQGTRVLASVDLTDEVTG
jgi:signal transduction histidine kinase